MTRHWIYQNPLKWRYMCLQRHMYLTSPGITHDREGFGSREEGGRGRIYYWIKSPLRDLIIQNRLERAPTSWIILNLMDFGFLFFFYKKTFIVDPAFNKRRLVSTTKHPELWRWMMLAFSASNDQMERRFPHSVLASADCREMTSLVF